VAERTIEIADGEGPRRVTLTGPVEIGREGVEVVVADTEVSRRHARLEPTAQGVLVTDLGSTNGTWVAGRRVDEPTLAVPGQLIGVGRTNLLVVDDSRLAHLAAVPAGPAVVRYVPGTAGEAAAPAVAAAVAEAARRLGALLPPDLPTVQVCLVDPFPDPGEPGRTLDEGTVVDADRAEIWMVTTPLVAPEPVDRPLAVLAATRAGVDPSIVPLYGGVALDRLGAPDPDPLLRDVDLPPLAEATGELQASMAVSFVRHLARRAGDEALDRFLAGASADDVYGIDLPALEDEWRVELAGREEPVAPVRFVRVAARYLRPHRWRQAEIFAYMLLGLAFTVVFPFAFQRLIDGPLTPDDEGRLGEFGDVVPILAVLGVVFVVSLLADLRRAYVSALVSNSVVRRIRQEIFDRLQVLEMAWFGRHQQGDVYGRLFTDVNVLEQGLSQAVRDGLFQALSLVVTAVVLVRLNWQLALIVLVGAPLVAVVYRFMAGGAQHRSVAVQERMSEVMGVAAENYAAQPVVKAFGLERRESERFDEASGRLLQAEVRLELFGGMFGLSVNMIVTVLRIVVMGTGAWLIVNGNLTPGAFVAFISLMGQVLAPVTVLTTVGQQIQESGGALARINEVLEAVPAVADRPGAVELTPLRSDIRLNGVGFGYTPDRRILHDVDLTITAGSKVAFVGPSGAGKSSVMQLLSRFYDPDEGSVTYDGVDLRDVSLASLRSQLGIVFQESVLFDTSIRENLRLARPDATDDEVQAAAEAAELHDFITRLPEGYETEVGERGGRLSGGQRQRLAIARALLRDPAVLLLDEATSALDPKTERAIAATLDRVGAGRTTVAITHRLGTVVDYDRIVVLDQGRVVEQGTHDELLARGGVYATLWAEQTGAPPPVGPLEGHRLDPVTVALPRAELPAVPARAELDAELERLTGAFPAARA